MEQLALAFEYRLPIAGFVAVLSGVFSGYAGFGGGLILTPILALTYSPIEAVALAAICLTATAVALVPGAAKRAVWAEVTPVLVAGVASVLLGLTFLVSADPQTIKRGMGVFVTLAARVLMSGWSYRGPRGVIAGGIAGACAGGVTGAFGIPGGPFNVLYLLSAPLPPDVQRSNIIVANMTTVVFLVGGLAVAGTYDLALLAKALMLAPPFVVGAHLGKRLFGVLPSVWFRRVALGLLLATGLSVLARW